MNEFFISTNQISWKRSVVGGSCMSWWFKNSSQAAMPSSWGMFVYSEETLRATRRLPGGNLGNLCNLLIKSMVSRICDGNWVTLGRRKKSAKREMFSVGAPLEATIQCRSTRVPRLVYFGEKMESFCSWMVADKEILYLFIYQVFFMHQVHTLFDHRRILRCWVRGKLPIVYRFV